MFWWPPFNHEVISRDVMFPYQLVNEVVVVAYNKVYVSIFSMRRINVQLKKDIVFFSGLALDHVGQERTAITVILRFGRHGTLLVMRDAFVVERNLLIEFIDGCSHLESIDVIEFNPRSLPNVVEIFQ